MVHDLINECYDAMRQEKLEFQYKQESRYRISLSLLNSSDKMRTVRYNLVSAETSGLEACRASDLSHFMRAADPHGTEKREPVHIGRNVSRVNRTREPVHKNRNCVPRRAS